MKFLAVASLLTLVGSCATLSHEKKLQNIKDNIVFNDTEVINRYAKTITSAELNTHVYNFSSAEFEGRKAGEPGHYKAVNYLKEFYITEGIATPLGNDNYYQMVPESFFSDGIKTSPNVIAFIEGSEYPEEILVISGHSDHEGYEDDIIFYGADDNGSGTAAMLEIAQAFKQAELDGHRPKRSIVFLHFTGEEVGLVGSRYYTKHPIFPLSNTIANLNTDMIGRVDESHVDNSDYIYLIGSDRLSNELHYISETANDEFVNLELDYKYNSVNDPNQFYSRSDHYNFTLKGVPAIFYFSGIHDDYNQPTDTAEKINYPVLQKRTKLIFTTAWYLANNEKRVAVDLDS